MIYIYISPRVSSLVGGNLGSSTEGSKLTEYTTPVPPRAPCSSLTVHPKKITPGGGGAVNISPEMGGDVHIIGPLPGIKLLHRLHDGIRRPQWKPIRQGT